MQEQLLHFIWQRKLFDYGSIFTTLGQRVGILHPGYPNTDQGPDFLQARIQLDDNLWAGHVEIHVQSSSWFLHSHERDPHYNNVILHVVWKEDVPAITADGIRVPCIELFDKVDHALIGRFTQLMNNRSWVPCASSLSTVSNLIKTSWVARLMSERLQAKTEHIRTILQRCNEDYEQAFFVLLARHFGSPANSEAFESLAIKVPLSIIRKHGDRIDQIESILFGVGGMLTKDLHAQYPAKLKREFDFLKKKYNLSVLSSLQWKFMRMRPAHFPTIRIAQLAVILSKNTHFISLLSEIPDAASWTKIFMVQPYHDYWKHHFHFRDEAVESGKRLGKETAQTLLINAVVPFMFFYARMQGLESLREKALRLLSELPPEKNAVIRKWNDHDMYAYDAGGTQGLLQLKTAYCDARRCLHCPIGLQLIKER